MLTPAEAVFTIPEILAYFFDILPSTHAERLMGTSPLVEKAMDSMWFWYVHTDDNDPACHAAVKKSPPFGPPEEHVANRLKFRAFVAQR